MIPLSIPNLQGNELKYVSECIETGWISSEGPYVQKFAEEIKNYTGAKYAIPCVNGTSALQTSFRILGLEPGDEVLFPSLTFIAPINAARYLNANPIFFDCDSYFNLDINQVESFLKTKTIFKNKKLINKITNNVIRAIVPVNIFGHSFDIDSLIQLAQKYGLDIIEDASEALGTLNYNGRHAGTDGLTGCLSFNGNKIISTGGGGMILTNNQNLAEKMIYLTTQAKDDKVFYVHNEIGYNFRMTNLAAALGVAQLENLPMFLEIKKRNFLYYKELIDKKENIEILNVPPKGRSNYWFYSLRIGQNYGKNLNELVKYLNTKSIQVRPIWKLNNTQLPYDNFYHEDLSNSVEFSKSIINIPCSTNITKEEIEKVVQNL